MIVTDKQFTIDIQVTPNEIVEFQNPCPNMNLKFFVPVIGHFCIPYDLGENPAAKITAGEYFTGHTLFRKLFRIKPI